MTIRGTTICAVRRNGMTAIAGDGQVTMGESVIMKNGAVKVTFAADELISMNETPALMLVLAGAIAE